MRKIIAIISSVLIIGGFTACSKQVDDLKEKQEKVKSHLELMNKEAKEFKADAEKEIDQVKKDIKKTKKEIEKDMKKKKKESNKQIKAAKKEIEEIKDKIAD